MPLTAERVRTRSFGGSLAKTETDFRLIGGGHAHRHIVDFDDEIGAGFDELALPGRENFGGLAGRVADQEIAGQRAGVGFFVFLRRRRGEEFACLVAGEVARARFADVGDDVMHHRAIRRARFGHLHPFVFFEAGGNDHVLIVDRAAGGNVKWLRELEDDVGLGNSPAIEKFGGRRQVFRIAFDGAVVGPLDERRDIFLRERAIVGEVAVLRIGEPRRHNFLAYDALDARRHGFHLIVGDQRKRAAFAGAVAGLAIFLEDRRDVFGEGGRRRRRARIARGAWRSRRQMRRLRVAD